jgi:glycosyltransferase involved in cell wall biosynthesis
VDTEFFTPGHDAPGDYFLVVSALVPYKRIDTAIRAAARLGAPLKIVGTGPDAARLRAIAGPDVEFLGQVDAASLRDWYRGARACILPGEEDFGIVPVEALACGRPVVALGAGGACDSVDHGVTGWLVDPSTPDGDARDAAFADAMARVAALPLTPDALQARAARFGVDRFETALRRHISDTLEQPDRW